VVNDALTAASALESLENNMMRPLAFCKGLEFLLDRVNAMRIDAANARLRMIAPVIKDHSIDYERGKFQVADLSPWHICVVRPDGLSKKPCSSCRTSSTRAASLLSASLTGSI
jgi:hypothetical protein